MSDIILFLVFAFDIVIIFFSLLLISFGAMLVFGAPFVPTPASICKEMLSFADVQPNEVFVDLGSGDGALLFAAAEHFHVKEAIGYEVHPLLVFWTNRRAKKSGMHAVRATRANFFTTPFPPADVVATYLWPETMDRLVEKLKHDLSPDTRVISRGFQFHHIEPIKQTTGSVSKLYLYRVGDL